MTTTVETVFMGWGGRNENSGERLEVALMRRCGSDISFLEREACVK